jgi:uncharacterized repeat protein (TIGR01451 family)
LAALFGTVVLVWAFASAGAAYGSSAPPSLVFSPASPFGFGNVLVGQSMSQTFTLTNAGGMATTALKLSRAGAAAFTITADTCTGTSLGPKKSCTFTAQFAPTAQGLVGGSVTATGVRGATATLSLSGTGTVPQNDVSVTKVDDHGGSSIAPSVGTVIPGTSVTYTVTVSNAGPATATNVGVADPVPTGITLLSWSGTDGSSGVGNLIDTIGSLAPGASVTYTLTATVDPAATGTLTNIATVTAANDSNPANNTATDTDNLAPQSDLSITKTDGRATYTSGTQNTYTVVVSNNGPSTATGVAVIDDFPAAVTGVTWSGTDGSSGTGNLNDTITSLAPGASVTYTLTATVDPAATGNLVNTASVTPGPGDTDLNPNNNSATDTDTPAPVSDLSVTKVDNQGGSSTGPTVGTVSPGQSFTYTVTVSNAGPSTAMNVGVSDPVPSGLSSFVWSGNGHTNVSGAITDTIVSLAPGASVTYTVSATVDVAATGTLTNTATVSPAPGTTDPNPNDNSATDTDTVAPPGQAACEAAGGTYNHGPNLSGFTFTTILWTCNGYTTAGADLIDPCLLGTPGATIFAFKGAATANGTCGVL